MMLELLLLGATTTICHRFTHDLEQQVRRAEILVVAVGKPGLVTGEWVRPDSIVIDVGMNRLDSGKLVGDIEFEGARERAAFITPGAGRRRPDDGRHADAQHARIGQVAPRRGPEAPINHEQKGTVPFSAAPRHLVTT